MLNTRAFLPLILAMVLLLLAGCGGTDTATPTISISVPTAEPTATPTPAPTDAPQASGAAASEQPTDGEPTPEPGPAPGAHDPNYVDTMTLDTLHVVDFETPGLMTQISLPEAAGWQVLGESRKRLEGTVMAVDDYLGEWVLALDQDTDVIVRMRNFIEVPVYTADQGYPHVLDVCMNAIGIHWVEFSDTAWRLMQQDTSGTLAVKAEGARGTDLPRVTAPEYHMAVFYQPDKGTIQAIDAATGDFHPTTLPVHTPQIFPPEAVNSRVNWIEETSIGWAVRTYDYENGTAKDFLLKGLRHPVRASFDGELLLVLVEDGMLFCYSVSDNQTILVAGNVREYQPIPGEGALLVCPLAEDEMLRYQYHARNGVGAQALISLVNVGDGGTVQHGFHHSYNNIDAEIFLVKTGGFYQQVVVSMQPLPVDALPPIAK